MRDEVRESSFPQMQIIHASVIDIEGHCMTPDDSIWRKERSEYHINQEASPSSLSPENAVFSDYTLRHAEHLIEKKMRLQICIPDKLNEIHRGQQIIGAHYGTLADAIQSLDQSCLTIDRGGWRRVSRLIAGMKDVLEVKVPV